MDNHKDDSSKKTENNFLFSSYFGLQSGRWMRVPLTVKEELEKFIKSDDDEDENDEINTREPQVYNERDWFVVGRPGYGGIRRKERKKQYDKAFGESYWQSQHVYKSCIIDRAAAILLYEEAYFHHISQNSELLSWITEDFCEVVDNSMTNIQSQCDYSIQETDATHLQDIAIRRVLLRLGKRFKGKVVLYVRGKDSNGYKLNPGRVFFTTPQQF